MQLSFWSDVSSTYSCIAPLSFVDRHCTPVFTLQACLKSETTKLLQYEMRTWLGRGRSLQIGITCCCLVAFVLFGYDQGVFSGILQNEDWLNQFDHPSDSKTGIIVSCYNLGCLLGCVGKSITPPWAEESREY